MVVVGLFSLSSNPNFSNVKFVNYVFIQTRFVKFKIKSYEYLLYFRISVVLVPSVLTFAWYYRCCFDRDMG